MRLSLFFASCRLVPAALTLVASLAGVTQGQSHLFTIPVESSTSVGRLGDIDGDGHADVLIGDPFHGGSSNPATGCYHVLNGRAGAHRSTCPPGEPFDRAGWSVSGAGDTNGDGVLDYVVGIPGFGGPEDPGLARVVSTKDDSAIWLLWGAESDQLGMAVCGVGDIDADGCMDVATGSPGAGTVDVWSVKKRQRLWQIRDAASFSGVGSFVGAAGDVNRDGHADIVVAASVSQRARVYSGKDATILHEVAATGGEGIGDLDRDGYGDYVLWGVSGRVCAYSGRDRDPLLSWPGEEGRAAGDLNRDRIPDVLVRSASGGVSAHSGRHGTRLFALAGLWQAMSGAGDVNGDGHADVVVGGEGRASVFSGRELPFSSDLHEVSLSKGGEQTLHLEAGCAYARQGYFVLGSMSGTKPGTPIGPHLVLPLNLDAYLLLTLANPNSSIHASSLGSLSSTGSATATFRIPEGVFSSLLAGTVLDHAFFVFDQGTARLVSNPVPVTLVL